MPVALVGIIGERGPAISLCDIAPAGASFAEKAEIDAGKLVCVGWTKYTRDVINPNKKEKNYEYPDENLLCYIS